jgi:hypothetical protein
LNLRYFVAARRQLCQVNLRPVQETRELLNEVYTFLRHNYDLEEDALREIRDTENELTHVCINYLGNWERIPSLKSQLLEVVIPTDPARHYYQTCFAVTTRGPANLRCQSSTKSQYGQYLYVVAGDLTVTFVFHLLFQVTMAVHCSGLDCGSLLPGQARLFLSEHHCAYASNGFGPRPTPIRYFRQLPWGCDQERQ